jgi:hypothetical protein
MLARPFIEFLAIFAITVGILLMTFFPSSTALVSGSGLILASAALLVGHYLLGTEPDSMGLDEESTDSVQF